MRRDGYSRIRSLALIRQYCFWLRRAGWLWEQEWFWSLGGTWSQCSLAELVLASMRCDAICMVGDMDGQTGRQAQDDNVSAVRNSCSVISWSIDAERRQEYYTNITIASQLLIWLSPWAHVL
jgi:hypothetical protein